MAHAGRQRASGWPSSNINLTDSRRVLGQLLLGFGQSIAFTPMTVMAFSTLPPRQVHGGLRRLHPDAQFRFQPVHLHRRAGRRAARPRPTIRGMTEVHHALQQEPVDAGLAAAVEPGRRRQPADPVERDPAAGGNDRLPERLLPDGLRRPGGRCRWRPSCAGTSAAPWKVPSRRYSSPAREGAPSNPRMVRRLQGGPRLLQRGGFGGGSLPPWLVSWK